MQLVATLSKLLFQYKEFQRIMMLLIKSLLFHKNQKNSWACFPMINTPLSQKVVPLWMNPGADSCRSLGLLHVVYQNDPVAEKELLKMLKNILICTYCIKLFLESEYRHIIYADCGKSLIFLLN